MIRLLSIADLISLLNAVFGFLSVLFLLSSIVESWELRIHISFTFIFLALLADGLDGIVARKKGHSQIGEYLESMADMTSMGIAPAVFIFAVYFTDSLAGMRQVYLLFALIIYIVFGIIRLASFHIMKNKEYFVGLPASAATIILLVLAYFKIDFVYIIPIVIIVAALMVCSIHFPKPDLKVNGAASVLIILSIILGKNVYGFAPILLIVAILMYSVGGPIYLWKER